MKEENKIKIFLVDDNKLFLKELEIKFLKYQNFEVVTFLTGEACVKSLKENPDVIILDYLLDLTEKTAMNGLQTLDEIKSIQPSIPVIILSAQDKIEVAVNCMHHKALDYVVKSETAFMRMIKIINDCLQFKKLEKQLTWYMHKM